METPMDHLVLRAEQVQELTGVPMRRVNEMAAKGIIPSSQIGGGKHKIRRGFKFGDLELIKEQYDINYPQKRPGMNLATKQRLEDLEERVRELDTVIAHIITEFNITIPSPE